MLFSQHAHGPASSVDALVMRRRACPCSVVGLEPTTTLVTMMSARKSPPISSTRSRTSPSWSAHESVKVQRRRAAAAPGRQLHERPRQHDIVRLRARERHALVGVSDHAHGRDYFPQLRKLRTFRSLPTPTGGTLENIGLHAGCPLVGRRMFWSQRETDGGLHPIGGASLGETSQRRRPSRRHPPLERIPSPPCQRLREHPRAPS